MSEDKTKIEKEDPTAENKSENKEADNQEGPTGTKLLTEDQGPAKKSSTGKKKKLPKILGITAAVILILLLVISLFMGSVIKAGVNTVLPAITGTPCNMDSCSLNLFTGTVRIKNFTIGNPDGYETKNAFKLKEVYVDLAVTSLLSKKIEIEDILVNDMEVSYEMKWGETNIGRILDNVNKLTKKDEQEKENPESGEPQPETKKQPGTSKGIQIDHFKFTNSKVIVHAGAGVPVPLPNIELKDIGKDSENGADAVEVTNKVFTALYDAIVDAVKNIHIDTDGLKKGTDSVIKSVKGFFGGSDDK